MDMVEKVARALAERNNDYCERGLLQWPAYEDDARAAIAALREPTPEMVDAGLYEVNFIETNSTHVRNAWGAMIDAALTRGPS